MVPRRWGYSWAEAYLAVMLGVHTLDEWAYRQEEWM